MKENILLRQTLHQPHCWQAKIAAGDRLFYAVKTNSDETEANKANSVAKGYKGTFSSSANMTSVCTLMQLAAGCD